jgi:hypothetical protein
MKLMAALLGLALSAGAQAGPTLAGDTIEASMWRTVDTGRGVGRISGFGLDAPFQVQDGSADQQKYSVIYMLDVDGDKFSLDFLNTFALADGIVLRLSGLDFSGAALLKSLTIDTNLTGTSVKVSDHFVELSLGGVRGNKDSYFNASFNTAVPAADVPEPASWSMVALGLAALAWVARRQPRRMRARIAM